MITLCGRAAVNDVSQGATYTRIPQIDDVERGSATADGMFRVPAGRRRQMHADVLAQEISMSAADTNEDPLSRHVGNLEGHVHNGLYNTAFKAGMHAKSLEHRQWANTRYWRCICGSASMACVALAAVLMFWTVNLSFGLSDAITKVNTLRPNLLINTIDDTSKILRGAADATSALGDLTKDSRPALVNLTSSGAAVLANLAAIAGQPEIHISMGHNAFGIG